VEVTPEKAVRFALFFNWDCAAHKFLSDEQKDIYTRLVIIPWKEFRETGNLIKWQMAAAAAWAIAYESL